MENTTVVASPSQQPLQSGQGRADPVLRRALRKPQNRNTKPNPEGLVPLESLGSSTREQVESLARLMCDRNAFLSQLEVAPGGRIGNVTLFPPSRRVRSTQDVALLEIGIA